MAGPLTGGQNWAHEPLQLDLVAVSGTNQYSVRPLALVSTVTPPMFAVFRAVLDEPVVGDAAALDELPDPAELPPDEHPDAAATTARATAATPADAHDICRIMIISLVIHRLVCGDHRWAHTHAAEGM